jgi:predicted transcriptional regulator
MTDTEIIKLINHLHEFEKRYKREYISLGEAAYLVDVDRKTVLRYAKELNLITMIKGVKRIKKTVIEEIKEYIQQNKNKRCKVKT